MGTFSIWHILIVGVLLLLLFGRPGKIANLMKDFGEGIKGFRKGVSDDPPPPAQEPPRQVADQNASTTQRAPENQEQR